MYIYIFYAVHRVNHEPNYERGMLIPRGKKVLTEAAGPKTLMRSSSEKLRRSTKPAIFCILTCLVLG